MQLHWRNLARRGLFIFPRYYALIAEDQLIGSMDVVRKKTPNLRHMIPTYSYIGAVLLRQFSGGFKKEHSTEGCWSADHWAVDLDLAHLKRSRPPEGRTKCRPRTNLEKEHLIPLFHLFFLVVCFHVLNAHLTQLLRGCIWKWYVPHSIVMSMGNLGIRWNLRCHFLEQKPATTRRCAFHGCRAAGWLCCAWRSGASPTRLGLTFGTGKYQVISLYKSLILVQNAKLWWKHQL